ncbi:MAG: translation initiation factor IF-2 N-terminal domain-containing protein, partial [Terriglobales bacterium]
MKIRINDLARELEVKSREILDTLSAVGITEKKTHSSSLEDHEAELVRKYVRSRSDASSTSSRPARAPQHGEEEFKTKIDLSHISRPGDALRAIKQQQTAPDHPPVRPVVKPVAPPPRAPEPPIPAPPVEPQIEAKLQEEEVTPLTSATVVPPKPAAAPPPPAPRLVTPASVSAMRPPAVVVIPPKTPPPAPPSAI